MFMSTFSALISVGFSASMQSKYGFDFTKKRAELHRKVGKNYPTRGVIAFAPMHILACDLVDYSKMPRRGFKYILNSIDVFSRRAESALLRGKTSKHVQKGLHQVFQRFGDKQPMKIWFDEEGGVIAHDTKQWLNKQGIELYHTYGTNKVSIAERFNRTQKSVLHRYEMADPRNKWTDFVQEFNNKYNETVHSSLGMTPMEAFGARNREAFVKNAQRYYKPRITDKPQLKVGDRVRILYTQGKFDKGYEEKWSREIFRIAKVKPTNPATYIISDDGGNELSGAFYYEELAQTRQD